ncbi:ATP-binding protein [uncultured Muribaculum sp.]|jgi:ATP-dependent DNA helicase RecG|uniref:ATP-binding protein n=2 Tax=Muribaculaceae TaxID=2005473 RepID=UPI0025B1217F|nr:ATP-binding protein [uncultured Muribaculum sp.]
MPLTKDEIRSLLSDIENERVERTLSTDNTKKISEAICSFANDIRNTNKPGYFLIGADDNGNLDGLTFSDAQLRSYAGLRNTGTILPPPAMMVYKETFPEGEVAVIEVQPSEDTPVRYKGVIWIRIGARKAEANTEEERILTEKGQIHSSSFDGRPYREATIDNIDIDLFKNEYLPKAVSPVTLAKDKRSVIQQLASLRLFDTRFNCPTYAGILLLGYDPQYFIPGAYIQYVKFAGTTRATKVLKENRFKGNLISMLKELEYFIKYSIESKRPEFVSVLREEPRINYPWEAIRELAMNAVMHRAYNGNNSPIKFYEYNDRIEIDNPGNLYGKVNLENFPNETDYRNPNIAEIMLNLGYVNRFGSGVNTVSTLLEENKSNPAEFLLGDYTTFKVVVRNADVIEDRTVGTDKTPGIILNTTESDTDDVLGTNSGTNNNEVGTNSGTNNNEVGTNEDVERKEAIIGMMKHNKRVSVTQISKALNIPRRTLFRIIDVLKTENRIKRVGDLKSGTWEVIE